MLYQNRNLLDVDGSVQISPQTFVKLDGDLYTLEASDKKTLIYFFAPWCTVCKFSINNLDIVDKDAFNIIRVALDYQSLEEIQAFTQDNGVEGVVLLGGPPHKRRFNISGYPTYYILDENLQVVKRDMGYSTSLGLKVRTAIL